MGIFDPWSRGWPSGPKTIIPKFDGTVLKFTDAQVALRKKGDQYRFEVTSGALPKQVIPIDGVVGRGLIHGGGAQTYFHRRKDGFMIFIPIEYNVSKQVWFCQTSGPKNWTPVDGTFSLKDCGWPPNRTIGSRPGASCQNCHGGQIDVRYNSKTKKYDTRFVELSIIANHAMDPDVNTLRS